MSKSTTDSPSSLPQPKPRTFQILAKDAAEEEAVFRLTIIGPLLAYDKSMGPKCQIEAEIASTYERRPGADLTTKFAPRTLRRWVSAFQKRGLDGLRPTPRNDRGHGRMLSDELRTILIAIRQENPTAATPTILEHLQHSEDPHTRDIMKEISLSTMNRFYQERQLARSKVRPATHSGERRKWHAAKPGDIWHADVCHGISLRSESQKGLVPLRVHGILDDASRRIVGIWATDNEREMTMIELLMRSVRRHGVPKVLYLDNGATYRGEALALVCARLNVRLLHAKPYDPEARGKMERFWRTLREQCLQFVGSEKSHHDVQGDLQNYLDRSYHPRPHSSLCGESPQKIWSRGRLRTVNEEELAAALVMRRDTQVRGDGTISYGGVFYEVPKTFLCSKKGVLIISLADPRLIAFEYNSQRYALKRVDAIRNAHTRRRPSDENIEASVRRVNFDPNASRNVAANAASDSTIVSEGENDE